MRYTMMRRLRSLWSEERGAALIEGAVLAPFLLILPFGVYEFSWFFYRQHLVSTGVRDAARYLARTSFNPCTSTTYQNNAKAIATTKGFTATAGVISGGADRV